MTDTEQLEEKWTQVLEYEGRNAVYRLQPPDSLDFDYVRDTAVDAVEEAMFSSEQWWPIPATEISDIACEIGNRVAEEFSRSTARWTGAEF